MTIRGSPKQEEEARIPHLQSKVTTTNTYNQRSYERTTRTPSGDEPLSVRRVTVRPRAATRASSTCACCPWWSTATDIASRCCGARGSRCNKGGAHVAHVEPAGSFGAASLCLDVAYVVQSRRPGIDARVDRFARATTRPRGHERHIVSLSGAAAASLHRRRSRDAGCRPPRPLASRRRTRPSLASLYPARPPPRSADGDRATRDDARLATPDPAVARLSLSRAVAASLHR
ncbi:MAG: hypothetical protein SGPRY_001774 [Prymnesium sp.]